MQAWTVHATGKSVALHALPGIVGGGVASAPVVNVPSHVHEPTTVVSPAVSVALIE